MRRLYSAASRLGVVLSLGLAAPACETRANAPAARTPGAEGLLSQLADEIDPGPVPPVWPTLPEPIRDEIEKGTTAPADVSARADEAEKRLSAPIHTELAEPDAWRTTMRRALEGLYLAEPIALGPPSAQQARCAALLERFYPAMESLPKLLALSASFAQVAGPEVKNKAAADASMNEAVLKAIGAGAGPMRRRLQALILRSGQPPEAVPVVLSALAGQALSRGEVDRAKALWAEVVRRKGEAPPWNDWLSLARASFRAGDLRGGDDALARARIAEAALRDERAVRRARSTRRLVERMRAPAERLLAPGGPPIEQQLARIDALLDLDLTRAAREACEALSKKAPRDARVRARLAQLLLDERTDAGDAMEGASAAQRMVGVPLDEATKDGAYHSLSIGLFGVRASAAVVAALARGEAAYAHSLMTAGAVELRPMAESLARFDPGRAEVLRFILDTLVGARDAAALAGSLRSGFAEARRIQQKHPRTADAYRLIYALALFAPDRQAAMDALAERPQLDPLDDPDVYRQRAESLLGLVATTADASRLPKVVEAARDIDGSGGDEDEAVRAAVLADARALEALLDGGAGKERAWAEAEAAYGEALPLLPAEGRARLLNNQGVAALARGDSQRAQTLFREALREPTHRDWVLNMNLLFATVPPDDGAARTGGLADIARSAATGDHAPPALSSWLALLLRPTDRPRAAAHAKAALAALRPGAPSPSLRGVEGEGSFFSMLGPVLRALRPDASLRGIEAEGSLQLSLGAAVHGRGHVVRIASRSFPWLMPPFPARLDDLEEIARAATPAPRSR